MLKLSEASTSPSPMGRQRRLGLLPLAGLALLLWPAQVRSGEAGPRALPVTPDLVVGTDSIQVAHGQVSVTVRNQGKAPSTATLLRLTERPPLAAAEDGASRFPHHTLLADEQGLVIWPEPHEGYFLLKVRWQGRRSTTSFRGRLRVTDAAGKPLSPSARLPRGKLPVSGLTHEKAGWTRWRATTGRRRAGFDLRFRPVPAPAFLILDSFSLGGALNLRQVFIGNWWITRYIRAPQTAPPPPGLAGSGATSGPGRVRIALQDVRLAHVSLPSWATSGLWHEEPLPGMDPGSQTTVHFALAGHAGHLFAQVDPENKVVETLEGNNTAAWRDQPGPVMLSLHTHASLSEGTASVDRQMDLLSRSGYDAVFWTEHDWRVSSHGLPALYGFETDPSPETWSTMVRLLEPGLKATATPTTVRASSGTHALRLAARRSAPRDGSPRQASFTFRAYRGTQVRSLAQDLSIAFDLFPATDQPFDSSFTVDLQLSDQPHQQRWLSYEIEAQPDAAHVGQSVLPPPVGGEPGRVSIPPGRWTRIVIPVSHHARLLFPEGVDNNVSSLDVGLKIWHGQASWDMDTLVMETAISGSPLLALEQGWTAAYPALASHVLNEISYYVPHFNAFVAQPFLLNYDAIPGEQAAVEAVRRTHLQNGALSLNHPLGFGLSYPKALIEAQIDHRLMGADLLEVGYRYRGGSDLAAHLKFWDRALSAGIVASGIGVTDAHGPGRGNGFERDENNFATWVNADPASRDSLIDALLAGKTTFGDPLLFSGHLDLAVDGRLGPGAVVLGPPVAHQVEAAATGLPPGSRLRLIVDGRPAKEVLSGQDGQATLSRSIPAATRFVRLESWDPRGEPLAFTNAILFLRQVPPEGLPVSRLNAAVQGMQLSGRGRFRLQTLTTTTHGFTVRGQQGQGDLVVSGATAEPTRATLAGSPQTVHWSVEAGSRRLVFPLGAAGLQVSWEPPSRFSQLTPGALIALAAGLFLLSLFSILLVRSRRRRARRRP